MDFLEKIQSLPEKKRKIILWLTVIIVSLALLTLWVRNFQQRIKSFEIEEFKTELKLPKLEIPKIQ